MVRDLLDSIFLLGTQPSSALHGEHEPLITALAFLVAVIGAYIGFVFAPKITQEQSETKKTALTLASSSILALSVLSAHIIGLNTFALPDMGATALLMALITALLSLTAFYSALSTYCRQHNITVRILIVSLLVSTSISSTHYMLIGILSSEDILQFNLVPFVFSYVVPWAFCALAWVSKWFVGEKKNQHQAARIIASLFLGLAVLSAHYLCSLASVITPAAQAIDQGIRAQEIGLAIAAASALALVGLTIAVTKRYLLVIAGIALFALPLMTIVYQNVTTVNVELHALNREHSGLVLHTKLIKLLGVLQESRNLTFAVENGGADFATAAQARKAELAPAIADINASVAAFNDDIPSLKEWSSLRNTLTTEPPESAPSDAPAHFVAATKNIALLIRFMSDVADDTGLSVDPHIDSDNLSEASIHTVPSILETLQSLRGVTLGALAAGLQPMQWNDDKSSDVRRLTDQLQFQSEQLHEAFLRSQRNSKALAQFIHFHDNALAPAQAEFEQNLAALSSSDGAPISARESYDSGERVVTLYNQFYEGATNTILGLLDFRAVDLDAKKGAMLYSSIAAIFGLVTLFFFLNRSLSRTENAQYIAQCAQKDLASRLIEKERLEQQMKDYTDRLELSRFDIMAANAKLKEGEAKIRAIMDNVMEGIITMDEKGIIQTFNIAAEYVFGITASEALGKNFTELVPALENETKEETQTRYLQVGTEKEMTGLHKNGRIFPMVIGISEVIIGKARLLIALVRDITAQKEKEEDLRQTKERAEAANRTKSEFLANMSHELRTPLNSVLGMTRLMMAAKMSDEQKDMANTVLLSATNLLEIVNDILDLSKIEAGEMALEYIGFDLHQVYNTVVRGLAHTAREKHVPIVRHYETETMPYVLGDPVRLGRVITNLLSNAIKYTNEGHVDVRATITQKDEDHIELYCAITDTGIGIPKEKTDVIFEKFVQADTSTTRKYGGTGLGLAITRELIALMGGRIGVESEYGKGSTFWFAVPFETTSQLHQEEFIRKQKTLLGIVPPKQARILVAEDHPMNQILIRQLLNKFGVGYHEIVANGVAALEAYHKGNWTVILMDCHMPEKNGYDTTIEIREIEKTKNVHVPIVAMTANAMVGDKEKCLHCGMDEYVSKPINIEELNEVLGQWISFKDEPPEEQEKTNMSPDKPPVDLTMLRTLTDGDSDIEKELLNTFVQQSDKNLVTLEDYRDYDGEMKPWTEAAHMLKGGSGSIGAETLRTLCAEAQLYKGDRAGRTKLYNEIAAEYARVKDHLAEEGLLG